MAAVVGDFTMIVGDNAIAIPIVSGPGEVPVPLDGSGFSTGARKSSDTALLMYSVKNMTGSAQVYINGNLVGSITATSGSFWTTQMIAVAGGQINDGVNHLVLKNVTDGFSLKDLFCFFHQQL
ncbi:MAG: hypothetical protein U0610_26500 [bacterium]